MPTPVYAPRVNNNDDAVKLNRVYVQPGAWVKIGDPLADVETDKATFAVEAETEGYVLAIEARIGEMVEVGTVLIWMGAEPGEVVSGKAADSGPAPARPVLSAGAPSMKALLLLSQYGLAPEGVPASGDRLSADDILRYVRTKGLVPPATRTAGSRGQSGTAIPLAGGRRTQLSPAERGMLRTVLWHRDEAVPGYSEMAYDPTCWQDYSRQFRERHGLLFDPMLPLMARRLTVLAAESRGLNATLAGEEKLIYDSVNLGFTMQSGAILYMLVVRAAETLSEADFVTRLGALQRRALRHELRPEESSGNTIAFTSMSRWEVSRHIPVLPPFNSVIVAHSAPSGAPSTLGATYDHRLLTGGEVAVLLSRLVRPPEP